MHNDLTNLLPPDRQKALLRDFFIRTLVVVAAMATALTLVAGALLIPTYVFLEASANTKKARLASIEASFSSSDEAQLSTRLSALSTNASRITALASNSSASAIIRSALAVARPGITLSGFSYTPAAGNTLGTLIVSGTAASRDALRNYQIALQSAPFARAAALPVSAYANDTDISFAITITLAP